MKTEYFSDLHPNELKNIYYNRIAKLFIGIVFIEIEFVAVGIAHQSGTFTGMKFSCFSVHKITDSKNDKPVYGFIMYKESGSLSDGWCTDTLRTYKDFKTLKTGDSLNKVRRIDPYFCLFENINKNIATGYHTLADGTEYVINYRRNNNYDEYHISSMVYKEEKSGLSSILLDIDRHLVEKDE